MLETGYWSALASTIFRAVISWGSGVRAGDAKELNKLFRKAGFFLACKLVTLKEEAGRQMVDKLRES